MFRHNDIIKSNTTGPEVSHQTRDKRIANTCHENENAPCRMRDNQCQAWGRRRRWKRHRWWGGRGLFATAWLLLVGCLLLREPRPRPPGGPATASRPLLTASDAFHFPPLFTHKTKNWIMVYVNADGTVGGPRKRRSPFRFISDLITGLFDFIGLFFRTLTASPSALEAERVSFHFCSMLGLIAGSILVFF